MTLSQSQLKLVRSLQHKKYRDELSLFVAEGDKCISELERTFKPYLYINYTPSSGVSCPVVTATATEVHRLSSLKTPQGSLAVFHKPTSIQVGGGAILTLDGIQDPGNLGTIIRTAVWFGVNKLICSLDTADCFAPKVVQATMGALAKVHITYCDLPAWLATLPASTPIYGTLLDGKDIYEVLHNDKDGGCADPIIIMGSEGNGISAPVRPFITHPVRIPTYAPEGHGIESLNVAIATAVTLAIFRHP